MKLKKKQKKRRGYGRNSMSQLILEPKIIRVRNYMERNQNMITISTTKKLIKLKIRMLFSQLKVHNYCLLGKILMICLCISF